MQKIELKSQEILKEATTWFNMNRLILNKAKTTVLPLTSKRITTPANAGSVKLLGITIDTRLTWRDHVGELSGKLSTALYAIRRIRGLTNRDTATIVYHALFHSRMVYGIEIWGESAHAQDILVLQKKAMRILGQVGPQMHCKPLFVEYKVMTLPNAYILKQLLRAKIELPKLNRRNVSVTYHLRSGYQVQVPGHRLMTTGHQHRHLELLNLLPQDWLGEPYHIFKKTMKRFLLRNPFYSVKEFVDQTKNFIWGTHLILQAHTHTHARFLRAHTS